MFRSQDFEIVDEPLGQCAPHSSQPPPNVEAEAPETLEPAAFLDEGAGEDPRRGPRAHLASRRVLTGALVAGLLVAATVVGVHVAADGGDRPAATDRRELRRRVPAHPDVALPGPAQGERARAGYGA